MVDDMCFIRSMHTEAINHEPAITFMQTGNQVTGRPCLGAWASYGLGSLNQNLPTFVVLVARPTNQEQVQAISARLWQSGYLPGEHAGVLLPLRRRSDPVHQQSAGRVAGGSPQHARRPAAAQRDELTRSSAIPRRTRASSNTRWPSACRQRPGIDRHRQRAGVHVPALRRRRPQAGHVRQHGAAWPGAWSSAASASCRSITTTGTRTATSPADCPINAATSISPAGA